MTTNEQSKNRQDKLKALLSQGILPYSERKFDKRESIQALVGQYAQGSTQAVSTAGRLSAKRGHGGLIFADLRDASGKIQICVKQDKVGDSVFRLFSDCDIGDILGVCGKLFQTKSKEVTIEVSSLKLLSKSLHPFPEKWHGLKDVEVRYRKRYIDLIANEPVRQVFMARSRLLTSIRQTLDRQGFLEVETPMMHPVPGGAAGEPFMTHHKALDMDLYLRLAPELYLKELLVGGFDRIYELNRSFRNEGVSTRHNPEFTMLEVYLAYQDCEAMMRLVQALICEAAEVLCGSLQFAYQGQDIDLTPPWERLSFAEAMSALGLKPQASIEEIQAALQRKGIQIKELNRSQLVRLVEQLFEPKTRAKPLFVTDYWTELSPLAKSKAENVLIADRFELFIGGMEVANAYSELNDPIEQRRRFEEQTEMVQGTGYKVQDENFLEALEYGMPPAGGLGVGIDRLAMLLLDQPSIKDVILFPLLKQQVNIKE
ncbi:MAG: lysine--tRNA ligase [Candidatus Omnitrophica bacterium]|nr:lysine--tRNA ligase [Candidatus Omnitrophota bacterium]